MCGMTFYQQVLFLITTALLLPEDSTKEECMERLSGNFSASLLPRHQAARHRAVGRSESRLLMSQSFGGAYMEMRGVSVFDYQ